MRGGIKITTKKEPPMDGSSLFLLEAGMATLTADGLI